jgi:hypothetical protein
VAGVGPGGVGEAKTRERRAIASKNEVVRRGGSVIY